MRKGAKDYKSYSKQIPKPISFEVFADDKDTMIEQGRKINSKNYVKSGQFKK